MAASRVPNRVPKKAYRNAAGRANAVAAVRSPLEARERIMLAAAVADLRESLYAQQCLLEALIRALAERGLVDAAELGRGEARRDQARSRDQEAGPSPGSAPPAASSSS